MNLRLKLVNGITRLFPSEAAQAIIHRIRLLDMPKPPGLMTVNKWGLRIVFTVLAIEALLLLMAVLWGVS